MKIFITAVFVLFTVLQACNSGSPSISSVTTDSSSLSPDSFRAIVKEAYIYGFPMVDGYRIQHAYFC